MILNDSTSSFAIARTNPKLTGNVKITVDSSFNIWLNSIDAVKELADNKFKKFPIEETSSYPVDLYNFFDQGSTQEEIVFALKEKFPEPNSISKKYEDQYDLFYAMGAQSNISNQYKEEYSFLAPLWIRDTLPEYFVIFRIKDPLDFPYNKNVPSGQIEPGKSYKLFGDEREGMQVMYDTVVYFSGDTFVGTVPSTYDIISGSGNVVLLDENKDYPFSIPDHFATIMDKLEIIKTFDLTENSKIGKYIKNFKNSKDFPEAPLTVRFEEELLTTFNGIGYREGVLTQKGEYLDRYWKKGNSIIDFEDFITGGFQRQGIICANLLNLEFLFDDKDTDLYTIPRYLGFYVSKNDLGSFQLSGRDLYAWRNTAGNNEKPKRDEHGYSYQELDYLQTNDNGVRLFIENTEGIIPDYITIQSGLRAFYIQDKNSNFHSLSRTTEFGLGNAKVFKLTGTEVFGSTDPKFVEGGPASWTNGSGTVVSYKSNGPGNPATLIVKDLQGVVPPYAFQNWGNSTSLAVPHTANFFMLYAEEVSYDFKDLILKDVSVNLKDFSGRGKTILQGRGELTDSKGRGYAVIKILGNLYPNDVIRIYWPVGDKVGSPNIGKYNEFIANDLSIPLGPENWGPKSAYEDDYFHPYGKPNEIAQAISKAMNNVEGKNFTAFAIGDEIVIRSNSVGSFSNSNRIEIYATDNSRWKVQGQVPVNGTFYSWEGGTDYSNTRIVKISLADSARLSLNDYIETDRGLSKISHIGRFVDLEKSGTLSGFTDYAALNIEDHLEEPLIGNSKSFKAVNLYRAPVGVFTFFDVKEIDGDFLSSTYGRSPIDEIKRYFDMREGEPVLEANKTYVVLGEGEIDFNGSIYPYSVPFQIQGASSDPGIIGRPSYVIVNIPNLAFRVNSGDPNFFTVVSGNPIVVCVEFFGNITPGDWGGQPFMQISNRQVIGYFSLDEFDHDLGSFNGFEILRSLTDVNDELLIPGDQDVNWRFRDKFYYKAIDSEYDYSQENYTTDRAVKSRLVPYISKWVYQRGKDVRDNPYRLNTSLAFGSHNFSSSFDVRKQDPSSFTHEWYYLEKYPEFYSEDLKKYTFSYFNEKLDKNRILMEKYDSQYNLIDPTIDYFQKYFTVDESDGMESIQERFIVLNYNKETGFVEGLFRGIKIRLFEVVPGGRTERRSRKPPFAENSSKFDEYKFSAILTIRKPDQTKIESPINIEVIENKTHKNITFLIELVISDSRINVHQENKLNWACQSTYDEPEYELFDESILDYVALYSLKDQKRLIVPLPNTGGSIINGIDDTKLHVGLNLSYPSGTSIKFGDQWVVEPFSNPDYDWDLRDEIHTFDSTSLLSTDNIFSHHIVMPPVEIAEEDRIYLTKYAGSPPSLVKFQNTTTVTDFIIPSSSPSTWKDNPVFQKEGGKLFIEPIMERISLSEIANKVNGFNPLIKYTSVELVGSSTVTTSGEFYMEFIPPTTIHKTEDLIFVQDSDKPEELKTTPSIGYEIQTLPVTVDIYRYSGPYEPKFRDLLFFGNQKSDKISGTVPKELFYGQALFNPSVTGFGLLKNLNYLKVSDVDILTLTKNDKYFPLYPLIGESPIDHKDQYIFHSNWDPGYYQEHITKDKSDPRAGTREMMESKNFFGSKIMKTRTDIKIEKILVTKVESLDAINLDLRSDEIIYEENDKLIRGIIAMDKRLVRFLIEDGADKYFKENLIPEFGTGDIKTINDDVEEYLRENILPSYFVKEFVFYSKQSQESLPSVVGDLSDKDKLANGYAIVKDMGINKLSDFVYIFEIKKNENFNISVAISMLISKI